MYGLYIAETYRSEVVFFAGQLRNKAIFGKARYGSSRSVDVIDIATNRKPTCDFL